MLGCGLPAPRLGKHPRTFQLVLVLVGGLGLQMGGLRRATGLLNISPAPGTKGSRMSPGVICLACCAGGWDGAGMEAGWRATWLVVVVVASRRERGRWQWRYVCSAT